MGAKNIATVNDYISSFPKDIQGKLNKLRKCIKDAAPDAEEKLSYGVPALRINKTTVCYAAFKNHIGLYPTPPVIQVFRKELAPYKCAKGTIQFPLDTPIPFDLVNQIIDYMYQK